MKKRDWVPHNGPTLTITCDNPAHPTDKPFQVARLFRKPSADPFEHSTRVWAIDSRDQMQVRSDQFSPGRGFALPLPANRERVSWEDEKRLNLLCPKCGTSYSLTWPKAKAVLDRILASQLHVVTLSMLSAIVARK